MQMMKNKIYKLELAIEESGGSKFKLENAVCNHGFFMMAPNQWIPETKTLQRPLRLADSTTSVTVSISQPPNHNFLCVRVDAAHDISSLDQQAIQNQIKRMLRISRKEEMSVQEFQNVHPEARDKSFGRLFRSPTLFEDAVKSLLLCNCTFLRTLEMAQALCKLQAEIASGLISVENKGLKRKRATKKSCATETLGNFPTPQELASVNLDILRKHCKLGYRAQHVHTLAQKVATGKLKNFEDFGEFGTKEGIYGKLLKIKGFGPFACANVLMCLGFYHKVPQDTETIRVLQKVHARQIHKKTIGQVVDQLYGEYAPFQCLAYWFDLIRYYESEVGSLCELPRSDYTTVSGSFLDIVNAKLPVAR